MSEQSKTCPECNSPYAYPDGFLWICPECAFEWSTSKEETQSIDKLFLDINGAELKDGDSVTVAKDLKLKGGTIKSGTKVRNIRLLTEPVNDHDISCKIDGFGSMYLKCSVVKKA